MRAAILAGGNASRFGGRPKGLERVGGERILDRAATALEAATGTAPVIIANTPEAPTWRPDLKVIQDVKPQHGSLGGIYTAVSAGDGPVLVVAWDMPFVSSDLLRAVATGSAGFDVFAPESDGPRGIEPLCAVYGKACGAAILDSMTRGDLSAVSFHSAVRVGVMPLAEVERHGPPSHLFFNINEPSDLTRAETAWQGTH